MPQVHIVLRKILFNSELFPFLEMVDILAVGFFSTDGVGLFPRRQRAGCSRIHFSRVPSSQKAKNLMGPGCHTPLPLFVVSFLGINCCFGER
jgi:hypothetical protein